MKLIVDPTKCDAYGLCVETAPDLFELDDFGYASVAGGGDVPEDRAEAARAAVQGCPAGAISLV
jgi:ferredoxin